MDIEDNNKYLCGKEIVDKLLENKNFVELSQNLILTKKGSSEYNELYTQLNTVVKEITSERTVVVKSDGSFYYDSNLDSSDAILIENHNTRPEIIMSIKFLMENHIMNRPHIPPIPDFLFHRGIFMTDYGISNRISSTTNSFEYNVAKTYSNNLSIFSSKVFTVRVSVQ